MFSIDYVNHKFIINKQYFSSGEREMYACLNINCDQPLITLDPRHISKKALLIILNMSYPGLIENITDNGKQTIQDIKAQYDFYLTSFYDICKERLWYFDKFYEHQKDVLFFSTHRKVCNSSMEQGLGKTITAVSDSVIHQFKTTIYITTSTGKWNCLEDLCDIGKNPDEIHWGFSTDWFTILDSKKTIYAPKERFILVNYDMLNKYAAFIIDKKPQHIIIDECHKIKSRDSKRTKRVIDICRKTNAKISLLSGTPSPNRTVDYFSYLNIANHPYGKNYYQFLRTFCETVETPYGTSVVGAKNTDKLHNSISNFMVRKIKANCLDLPAKNFIKINFELNEYQEEYDKQYQEFIRLCENRKTSSEVAIHTINRIVAKAKLKQVYELIDKILEDEEIDIIDGKEVVLKKTIAIYTTYTECIDAIHAHYKDNSVYIDGRVDSSKRMAVVARFKNDPKIQIFIGQDEAAAEALNMNWCNDLIFLNFKFTQDGMNQCMDRFHRAGKKKTLNVYFTVCKQTIDEHLYKLVGGKYKDTSHLIDGSPQTIQAENTGMEKLLLELTNTKTAVI